MPGVVQQFVRFSSALALRSGELMGEGSRKPLEVSGRAPTWLALHGYCGAPEEMRLVVDVAEAEGYRARAPALEGHGTHARDLASLGFDDWYRGARAELALAAEQGPVLLVGLSLGSLLATQLTLDAPEQVLGLVLLANAFFLRPFPAWPLRWVDTLGLGNFGVPKYSADIGDERARGSHLTYSVQPVKPAISLLRAGQRLFGELSRVRCPILIVHGAHDRLCPVANAWRVAAALGTEDVQVVILPRSHHIVTRDRDAAQLHAELRRFSRRVIA
jgi:carboxylesterase